jgi:hypothetical protein
MDLLKDADGNITYANMYYIGTETAEIKAGTAASLEYEEYYSTDPLTGAPETTKPRL